MGKTRLKKAKNEELTLREVFGDFINSQEAKGVAAQTVKTYKTHFQSVSKHLNMGLSFGELKKADLDRMIVSMRSAGLAHNSISSYVRVMKTFLNWSRGEGYTTLTLPNYKQEETIKETYTDDELERLLRRPAADCSFCEFRNWAIINFLLNCGCRAATVRNIQVRDVSLADKQVIFRHTKTRKIQVIPLCSRMVNILREYMAVRGGDASDYLFCDEYGGMLSENALRLAIAKYNRKRGVQTTSIHLFRHTFARKYLLDCGGDVFSLQKILGHSTLKMTKHYCAIYDADIAKNYDLVSPLAQMGQGRERIQRA